jgi:6-phosphogluconolactonase
MITVFDNLEKLSRAAAELITERAVTAVAERERFLLALAGGHTPKRTYELLAAPPVRDRMPWANVHVFWGDERCVPPDDSRSNQRMVREALLDHVPIPPEQIHPIECSGTPRESAERYERELHEHLGGAPRFDFILLGLGDNGHTASLFPHTPVLAERQRWAAEVHIDEQQIERVTLTAPVINQARTILFLVSGEKKATALQAVRHGSDDADSWPAQLIQPADGELLWYVDTAAAASLATPPSPRNSSS